jgi:DNA-binding protein
MDMNNHQNIPTLKPIIPIPQLKYNEIGIRSDLKGYQIKNLIDKIIFFLIYKKYPTVTLKSRGKGIQKLISIQDILRRKILGLYIIQKTYSTSYISEKENNKEVKLPCLDVILSIEEPSDKTEGFFSPLPIEDLDKNYIDPKNPINFQMNYQRNRENNFRGRYRAGFRGRGRGRGNNNLRNNNNFRRGNYNMRNNYYNQRNNYYSQRYYNYNQRGNFEQRDFYNNYNQRGRNFRQIRFRNNRGRFNRMNDNNNYRREDEDYRGFKGGNRNY